MHSNSGSRMRSLTPGIWPVMTICIFLLCLKTMPQALAAYQQEPGQTNLDWFRPTPTQAMSDSEAQDVSYSVGNISGVFSVPTWAERGMRIRAGGSDAWCLGNLSWALMNLGALSAGEYSSAAGTLALLPTAGALIGAPTKEQWLIFKLVPIAGALAMLLSLGGTIVPSSAADYDLNTLNYGGMVATHRLRRRAEANAEDQRKHMHLSSEERFARRVATRARDVSTGGNRWHLSGYIILQFAFFIAILVVFWYGQRGAVIPWWCRVWGWMYFWLFLVIVVSISENYSSIPFSKQWTMRVSQVPSNIEIGDGPPRITRNRSDIEDAVPIIQVDSDNDNVLAKLAKPQHSHSKVKIFRDVPSTKPSSCFYVVISLEHVSKARALWRFLSKGGSLAVYAFGTAIFAAAQLMSITAALMILTITIGCAALSRNVAMLIAAEINSNGDSIIHAVVRDEDSAASHVEKVLAEPGLLVEIGGHIIINGRMLHHRSPWLDPARYIGLLAPPFDLEKIAVPAQDFLLSPSTTSSRSADKSS